MRDDPIIEEIRKHRREFAAQHGNDLRRMCEALRKLEAGSGHKVVNREPKRLKRKGESQAVACQVAEATSRYEE